MECFDTYEIIDEHVRIGKGKAFIAGGEADLSFFFLFDFYTDSILTGSYRIPIEAISNDGDIHLKEIEDRDIENVTIVLLFSNHTYTCSIDIFTGMPEALRYSLYRKLCERLELLL